MRFERTGLVRFMKRAFTKALASIGWSGCCMQAENVFTLCVVTKNLLEEIREATFCAPIYIKVALLQLGEGGCENTERRYLCMC